MDFTFSPEQEALREEVRQFVKEHPPENYSCVLEEQGEGYGGFSREYALELGKKRWTSICIPEEYGGLGRSLTDMFVLKDELAVHGAHAASIFFTETVAFSIMYRGTEEQKREFLPKMARGELVWATGLSEPDAGSDLFGMKTTAVKQGTDFVINGNKVWNTHAYLADWLLVAAITDPQAQSKSQTMSTFLVDTKSPGITMRPVKEITGDEAFTEIFFDQVRVPEKNLLGPLNHGFAIIMESLEGDRFWARMTRPAWAMRMLNLVMRYCKENKHNRASLSSDLRIRDLVAEMAIEAEVCRGLAYNIVALYEKGINVGLEASHEESLLKVFADEFARRLTGSLMQILGPKGQLWKGSKHVPFASSPFEGLVPLQYLYSFGSPLAGGSTQMQRQTIATRGLGLPIIKFK